MKYSKLNRRAIVQVRTGLQATAQQVRDDLTAFLTEFGISPDDFAVYDFAAYEFENEIQLRSASPEVQTAIIALLAWDHFVQKSATISMKPITEFAGSPGVDINRLVIRADGKRIDAQVLMP